MADLSICTTCGAGYARGTGDAHRSSHDVGRVAALGAWWEVFARDSTPRSAWPERPPSPDGAVYMVGPEYSETVRRFHMALYDTGWIVPFDWPRWANGRGSRLFDDPVLVARVGPDDLARILTTVFRSERFGDGAIAEAFRMGLIDAVLRRAQELGNRSQNDPIPLIPNANR